MSAQDYYPFGMMQPGRSFSSSSYRYGFNGQEHSDEIAGVGNHNTAEFWEYDTRLGRRWNLDPVSKPWQSDYSVLSDNPIWKIDPNGADDIFTSSGKFVKHVNNKTDFIMIQQGTNKLSRIHRFNGGSKWFSSQDNANRNMMGNVMKHYADKVGISGSIGIDNTRENPDNYAHYDPASNNITLSLKGGYWQDILSHSNVLTSVLEHESFHKKDAANPSHKSTFTTHSKVYINQMKSETFSKTPEDFQNGTISNFIWYLRGSKDNKEAGWTSLMIEFNKTNKAGYTIKDRKSGGFQLFDKRGTERIIMLRESKKDPY